MLRAILHSAAFLITGIVFAIAAVPVMAVIMAIAIPAEYFSWFRAHDILGAGLFIVNFALVFLSLGIPSAAFLLVLHRFLCPFGKISAFAFLIGFFMTGEFAVPIFSRFPILDYTDLPWFAYASHTAIVSAVILAYLAARQLGRNRSLKPAPPHNSASIQH